MEIWYWILICGALGSERVAPANENPFQLPQTPHQRTVNVHFADTPGEDFDFSGQPPDSPTPARVRAPRSLDPSTSLRPQLHQTPHRTPRTPRPVGGHRPLANRPSSVPRPVYHRTRRSGTSSGRRAKDVWTFFKDIDNEKQCHFCQYVMSLLLLLCCAMTYVLIACIHRLWKAEGKQGPFNDYGRTTGTTNYCEHLRKYHLKPWIESCVAQNIPLTSVAAQKALQEYKEKYVADTEGPQSGAVPSSGDTPSTPLSHEAMVDAIMEHIIADDEVCCSTLNKIYSH